MEVDRAPTTATNFLRYVDRGFYDGGCFFRSTRADNYVVALPDRPLLECIQATIRSDRAEERFEPISLEHTGQTGLRHLTGTVAMGRRGPDTATTDFFILLNPQPSLDYGGSRFDDRLGTAAFGRVTAGLETV